MRRRALPVTIVLLLAPTAASWGNDAIDEPSSRFDRPEWMWPTANDVNARVDGIVRDRLYFNAQISVLGLATVPQAPGGRVPLAVVGAEALLGYWRDCNNDGYVGNRLTGQVKYLAAVGGVDGRVCPPGSAFRSALSPYVYELIQVGSHRGVGANHAFTINDPAARVWGDFHRPDEPAYAQALDVAESTGIVEGEGSSLRLGDFAVRLGGLAGDAALAKWRDGPLDLDDLAFRLRNPYSPLKRENDFVLTPNAPLDGGVNFNWPWAIANLNKDAGGWYSREIHVMNVSEFRQASYATFYASVGPVGLHGRNAGSPVFQAPGPIGLPGARIERGEWTAARFAYGAEACAAPAVTRWDCANWPGGPFPAWEATYDRVWGAILGAPYHLRDTDCFDLTPAAPDVVHEARANANYLWDYTLTAASGAIAREVGTAFPTECE